MQTAVHTLPPPLYASYTHQTLNGMNGASSSHNTMPTPPVASSRKRKRANHEVNISYSEVQEVDPEGKLRDIIVIEDTPPPTMSPATTRTGGFSASYQPPIYSAPIRTRARAAAEAQALSSSSASAVMAAPPPKKRKRDHADETRALPSKKAAPSNYQLANPKTWDTQSAATSVEVRLRVSWLRHTQQ